jgi:GNAT superfamily N-acetyltransferase
MSDLELVREIESAAYLAWPAWEVVEYDGWQLRFADGFSRRGNSVYPAHPSTLPYATKLDWCGDWYRERGQPLIVRQTPASEAGLDQVLAEAGFTSEGWTLVMTGSLLNYDEPAADIPAKPDSAWYAAAADLWQIPPQALGAWRGIIERIDHPAAFVHRTGGDGPEAAGLAVVVDEWQGLFEIIVRPDLRRTGVGSSVARSLLSWGWQAGARRAFLQVVEDNRSAISLYERLGFAPAYSYWYRRAPG